MAERGKKRYTTGEVLEAIFEDDDSNDEQFDCGYTQLLQNTQRLQNPVRRLGQDNIIRLTGRNHWPG